jgi:hypothetical protein
MMSTRSRSLDLATKSPQSSRLSTVTAILSKHRHHRSRSPPRRCRGAGDMSRSSRLRGLSERPLEESRTAPILLLVDGGLGVTVMTREVFSNACIHPSLLISQPLWLVLPLQPMISVLNEGALDRPWQDGTCLFLLDHP